MNRRSSVSKRPPPITKHTGKRWGSKPPTFSNRLCGRRGPLRPPKIIDFQPGSCIKQPNVSFAQTCRKLDPLLLSVGGLAALTGQKPPWAAKRPAGWSQGLEKHINIFRRCCSFPLVFGRFRPVRCHVPILRRSGNRFPNYFGPFIAIPELFRT